LYIDVYLKERKEMMGLFVSSCFYKRLFEVLGFTPFDKGSSQDTSLLLV